MRIRIPGLETILEHGSLPEDLVDIALLELTAEGGALGAIAKETGGEPVDEETEKARLLNRIREYGSLQQHLVARAVVQVESGDGWEPVLLDREAVSGLPVEDVQLVAEIVMRLRCTDARGVTIGVDPLSRWEAFREAHGCDPGCEECAEIVAAFSSGATR